MIVPPTGVRVLVATKPVDFRKGMDGLAAYVQEALKSRSVLAASSMCSGQARRPGEAAVLGSDRPLPADASGWKERKFRWPAIAGWRDAAVAGAALGAARGAGLGAGACAPCRPAHSDAMIHMFG